MHWQQMKVIFRFQQHMVMSSVLHLTTVTVNSHFRIIGCCGGGKWDGVTRRNRYETIPQMLKILRGERERERMKTSDLH